MTYFARNNTTNTNRRRRGARRLSSTVYGLSSKIHVFRKSYIGSENNAEHIDLDSISKRERGGNDLLVLHGVGPAHLAGRRGVGNDVLAVVEGGPQAVEEGVLAVVEVAQEGLDGLGGFVGIVEGDFAAAYVSGRVETGP